MFTTFPCESSSSERNSFHGGLPSLRNVSPDACRCGYFVNWKAAHDCRWRLARERRQCACTATDDDSKFQAPSHRAFFSSHVVVVIIIVSMLFLCISSQFFAINAKAPNLHENLPRNQWFKRNELMYRDFLLHRRIKFASLSKRMDSWQR